MPEDKAERLFEARPGFPTLSIGGSGGNRQAGDRMFVAKVVSHSAEQRINDGDYTLSPLDPAFQPIIVEETGETEDIKVIAEFVTAL